MLKIPQVLIALGLSLSVNSAYAHTIWIGHVHGEDVVLYGHGGNDSDPYNPNNIRDVKGSKLGKAIDVSVNNKGHYIALDTHQAGIVSLTLDNGYWCKVEGIGWVNKPKSDVNGKVDYSSHSYKYTVAYMNGREKTQVIGAPLEIVPQINPTTLTKGDKLTVQVLYDGKPLADAKVTADYFESPAQREKTDYDGKVTLTVANNHFNIIEVGHKAKLENDPDADELTLSASLTFEAKQQAKH